MKKLISELFGLQGFVVYECRVHTEHVDIKVGRPRKEATCPRCGSLTRRIHSRSHKWHRKLHALSNEKKVFILVKPRRFRCEDCGKAFTETFPGMRKWARRTDHAEETLLGRLKGSSFSATGRELAMGYKALRRALFNRVTGYVDVARVLGGAREIVLGIDEHSYRGSDLMITVTCVSPERHLLAILENDRKSTLRRFLQQLPAEVKARVVGVCIDMTRAFRKLVAEEFPHVVIVADHFHVIQDANRRIEEARRVEQQITGERIKRWPLIKNEFDLTERQQTQLADIRQRHKNVAHFHWVKEQLRDVYDAPDKGEARQIIERIILNCQAGSDAALVQWGRTLTTWSEQILAFHDLRVSNGYTEGVHTKIKLVKRLSYGFRNRDVYVRKMLLAFVPLALLSAPAHFLT